MHKEVKGLKRKGPEGIGTVEGRECAPASKNKNWQQWQVLKFHLPRFNGEYHLKSK